VLFLFLLKTAGSKIYLPRFLMAILL
jgi:hypothetical protein